RNAAGGGGAAEASLSTTPVAAAASVPASFTSTNALWTTALTRSFSRVLMPLKSAATVKASSMRPTRPTQRDSANGTGAALAELHRTGSAAQAVAGPATRQGNCYPRRSDGTRLCQRSAPFGSCLEGPRDPDHRRSQGQSQSRQEGAGEDRIPG